MLERADEIRLISSNDSELNGERPKSQREAPDKFPELWPGRNKRRGIEAQTRFPV